MKSKVIIHYGIKGMKWGVRKDRSKSKSSAVKKMSDEDLRAAVNRLQLERQYDSLTNSPGLGSKGKKLVSGVIASAALTSALESTIKKT